jgi:hypothetical protein
VATQATSKGRLAMIKTVKNNKHAFWDLNNPKVRYLRQNSVSKH